MGSDQAASSRALGLGLAEAPPTQPSPQDARDVGLATRAISWLVDALVLNLAAIMTGLGAELVISIFPLSKQAQPALTAIAGAVYVLWCAAYFVVFWSTTGQTPGARVMQIRLVSGRGERVKPARAVVRWIGMNLAMIPLFAGFLPILFNRRAFPDWLAHTLVLDAPQISLAGARREAKRAARLAPTTASRHLPTDANRADMIGPGR